MDTSGTNYYMFKLKNKEFTFDVDNSQVFFNFKTFTENSFLVGSMVLSTLSRWRRMAVWGLSPVSICQSTQFNGDYVR